MTLMIFDAAAIGSEMPFEGIEFEGWLLLDGWDGMGGGRIMGGSKLRAEAEEFVPYQQRFGGGR